MTLLTTANPIPLAQSRTPEWYERRRGGITGTEIRDWPEPAKRRKITKAKVTGDDDMGDNRHFRHGRLREPQIAEWAVATFGVVPEDRLHAHPENPRHLATPDGYLAAFSAEAYQPGANAIIVEIKTTSKDLTPGKIDPTTQYLVSIDPSGHFAKMRYIRQIMWEMHVMNAEACMFIWEPFDNTKTDPDTGTFVVTGPPQYCFIRRDDAMIAALIEEADAALAHIDAARAASMGGMPTASDIPTDEAILLADLFAAREAVSVAEAARDKAWAALSEHYEREYDGDFSEERGDMAQVTRSTPLSKPGKKFDRELAAKKAPKALEAHDKFIERYTVATPGGVPGKPRLTITDRRGK
ncbi:exonuclease [Microbacterium phage ClearAsMud]|uniref:Exonuclease n=1 Tax=Microbacterium phage ClearAsMud TaxID=2743404 RepID=A0A7G9A0X2_9CAUD|nr:exonuclease [Microbacterium phage ClearAsMud]QNL30261.1 exonuclease [Microbacterium phage ClearAsMud]